MASFSEGITPETLHGPEDSLPGASERGPHWSLYPALIATVSVLSLSSLSEYMQHTFLLNVCFEVTVD